MQYMSIAILDVENRRPRTFREKDFHPGSESLNLLEMKKAFCIKCAGPIDVQYPHFKVTIANELGIRINHDLWIDAAL